MAKRKKHTSAHKKGDTRGRSTRTAARPATKPRAKKVASRVAATAKTKNRASKARAMRAAARKSVPRSTKPSMPLAEPRGEAVIVDMIEEPLPGVVVVTEFEAVRTKPDAPVSKPGPTEGFDIAEDEEEED